MEDGELSSCGEDRPTKTTAAQSVENITKGNLMIRKKWQGCFSLDEFKIEQKVGEGTFGVVHKAIHRKTGKVVALKKILLRPEQEGFPITALREVKLLKLVKHPNVMSMTDMAISSSTTIIISTIDFSMVVAPDEDGGIYMVFPFMDHDLTGLLESPDISFTIPQIKCYMKQLLSGLSYLHAVRILHRDVKGANLLLNNVGELKITDFGLARPIEENRVHYTPGVVTRWYRPPELLFGATKYTTSVDIWGVGCILGEMLTKKPLLPGESDLHQLDLIAKLCGTPTEETMPGCSKLPDFEKVKLPVYRRKIMEAFSRYDPLAADLMDQLMQLDPVKRPSAEGALKHQWFTTEPLAALPSDLPVYKSRHEADNRSHAPHPTPQDHGRDSYHRGRQEEASLHRGRQEEASLHRGRQEEASLNRGRQDEVHRGKHEEPPPPPPPPTTPKEVRKPENGHPADRFYRRSPEKRRQSRDDRTRVQHPDYDYNYDYYYRDGPPLPPPPPPDHYHQKSYPYYPPHAYPQHHYPQHYPHHHRPYDHHSHRSPPPPNRSSHHRYERRGTRRDDSYADAVPRGDVDYGFDQPPAESDVKRQRTIDKYRRDSTSRDGRRRSDRSSSPTKQRTAADDAKRPADGRKQQAPAADATPESGEIE